MNVTRWKKCAFETSLNLFLISIMLLFGVKDTKVDIIHIYIY